MKLYLWNSPSTIQFQMGADAQNEPVNQDIYEHTLHHKGEQIWRLGDNERQAHNSRKCRWVPS